MLRKVRTRSYIPTQILAIEKIKAAHTIDREVSSFLFGNGANLALLQFKILQI